MPTYPHRCPGCHHRTLVTVPMAQRDDTVTCPSCEEHDMTRLFVAPPVVYKTGGFYATSLRDTAEDVAEEFRASSNRYRAAKGKEPLPPAPKGDDL